MNGIPKSFRFQEDTVEHLNTLTSTYNTTATKLIETMINLEYDKLMGNPELNKIINKMNELKSTMEGFAITAAGTPSKSGRAAAAKVIKK